MATEEKTTEEKTMLVLLQDHAKPVTFCGGKADLVAKIREKFDVLKEEQQLFLKVYVYVCAV